MGLPLRREPLMVKENVIRRASAKKLYILNICKYILLEYEIHVNDLTYDSLKFRFRCNFQ